MATAIELAELEKAKRLEANLFSDMKEILPFLNDEKVSDIACSDTGELIISRFGEGRVFTNKYLSPVVVQRIIYAAAAVIGAKIDVLGGFPVLEGVIPKYNARITGLLPPIVSCPQISIRRPLNIIKKMEDYVTDGQLKKEQYDVIVDYIKQRKNIIVSGSTGSGKTTFTNAIIQKMEEFTPADNFYIVEDTPELKCTARMKHPLCVKKNEVHLALETALRFHPDRIIFGEVRNGTVMSTLLEAWNTGHSGNVTTLHADNCLSTIQRIKGMLKKVNSDVDKLSDAVQLIIHLRKTPNGITIDEVMPVKEDTDSFINMIEQNALG